MSKLRAVLMISVGVFGGGILGFWYRETYWVEKKEKEKRKMEEELKALSELRRRKEALLINLRNETTK